MFALTAKQYEAQNLLAGSQRHTLGKGGARSGKTFLFIRSIFIRAIRAPNSHHVALRFRINAARQSLWLDTIPAVSSKCFQDVPIRYRERDGYIEFPNRARLWVGGLDDKERVEKILGQEHATIYFNECSQIRWSSIPLVLTRLAQKCEGLQNRAYYDLNPVGKSHWTYKLFTQHVYPDTGKSIPDPEDYAQFRINPADNRPNIDGDFIRSLEGLPERQKLRFLEGQDQDDSEGQLWTLEMLAACRVDETDVPTLKRIVVAVDPSGSTSSLDEKHDAIGISVVGLGVDDHVYILEDATGAYSPEGWGKKIIELYRKHKADCVVAEENFGGAAVRAVIRSVILPDGFSGRHVRYKPVIASRGKVVRAEPIAARYEQGLVHHVGMLDQLEEELQDFRQGEYVGEHSPNAADAAIWGVTELLEGRVFLLGVVDYVHEEKERLDVEAAKRLAKPATSAETERCPECESLSIAKLPGGRKRCGACGHQWPPNPDIETKLQSPAHFLKTK